MLIWWTDVDWMLMLKLMRMLIGGPDGGYGC
jgi:hypothetical protein